MRFLTILLITELSGIPLDLGELVFSNLGDSPNSREIQFFHSFFFQWTRLISIVSKTIKIEFFVVVNFKLKQKNEPKNLLSNKIWVQRKLWVERKFWVRKILGWTFLSKIVLFKIFLGQKKFIDKKFKVKGIRSINFGAKKCWIQKNLGLIIFLIQNYFLS